jgi:hypothetical protein
MRSQKHISACSRLHRSLIKQRPVLFCIWLTAIIQIIYTSSSYFATYQRESSRDLLPTNVRTTQDNNNSLISLVFDRYLNPLSRLAIRDLPSNQLLSPKNRHHSASEFSAQITSMSSSVGSFILMAEAGKKKKEKSEVVVISVQNPPAKGHGMYPIYIPTCGGHHHGYGRRKRRSIRTSYV